jgi:hypothetical protein
MSFFILSDDSQPLELLLQPQKQLLGSKLLVFC